VRTVKTGSGRERSLTDCVVVTAGFSQYRACGLGSADAGGRVPRAGIFQGTAPGTADHHRSDRCDGVGNGLCFECGDVVRECLTNGGCIERRTSWAGSFPRRPLRWLHETRDLAATCKSAQDRAVVRLAFVQLISLERLMT
jgi:hypothetical protein